MMRAIQSTGEDFKKIYRILSNEFEDSSASALILALLLEQLPVLVALATRDGSLIFASHAHYMLNNAIEDLNTVSELFDLYPVEAREKIAALPVQDPLEKDSQLIPLSHRDGSQKIYRIKKTVLHVKGQSRVLLMASAEAGQSQSYGELDKETYKSVVDQPELHDAVTGVANRYLLYDRLDKTLSLAKRNKTHFAILLVDLDRFKEFNEQNGRETGDLYLQHVAKHFCAAVRDTDTVARMSGDEFIIILDNVEKAKDIEVIAHKLIEPKSLSFEFKQKTYSCTASVGISLFPKDGDTSEDLLRNADKAMSEAKKTGKNQHLFYIRAMTDAAANYLLLENDLQKAIDSNELELYFQPQVNISNGAVHGLEVLCRWQHSSRGLLPPAHFIPLAEEIGMIETLGRWVLKESCQRFKTWLDEDIDLGKLSVNVSGKQFRNPLFKEWIYEALIESGLPYERLELELTETSTMQNATRAIEVLTELRRSGVSVALDDFGTGYSSLAYLRRFPIQKLKIDKSFIENVDRNSDDEVAVKSIIDLAHNMSLEVIAEGVEREEQLQWLKEKGCDLVQGYLYAKPLSAENMLALITGNPRADKREGKIYLKRT